MKAEKFDAIIIGAGQSGPALTATFSKKGKKVAIIERKYFGGTCINNGCIPSKTYVADAKIAHSIRRGKDYGFNVDLSSFSVDLKKIKARKDAILFDMRSNLKKWMLSLENCTVIEEHASFISPKEIKVGNRTLTADQFFIDVGGRANIPDIKGLEQVSYLTNSSILDLEELPKHLVIIGGGYVGAEFAQVFARFGSNVSILQKSSQLMKNEDKESSDTLQKILEKEGVKIYLSVKDIEVLPGSAGKNIRIRFRHSNENKILDCSHLLLATGRRPNTDTLGLENAKVRVNGKGFIEVNDQLQTSQSHIWAMGECNGHGAFTHTSYNDFQIVAANLLENKRKGLKDRIPIFSLFVDPPMGRVGLTEKEALAKDLPILKAIMPMKDIPRARAKGETEGFLKIIVHEKTKEILGACFFGSGCDEIIQLIAEVMYAKKPYTLIKESVLIHPTVSEMIPVLLERLLPVKVTVKV